MNYQPKYIQFPVNMLSTIFDNPKRFFDQVISVGSSMYAGKVKADTVEVARQLIYHYITDPQKKLTNELNRFIKSKDGSRVDGQLFSICDDRQYYFAESGKFNCMADDQVLAAILEAHPEKLRAAKAWYKHLIACHYLSIQVLNMQNITNTVESNNIEGQPLCMVNLDIVWDFKKNTKSENQIAQFAAYASIKSILGKKPVLLTNKQHIVARMFGAKSIKTLPAKKHPLFEKYMNRYHIDKILEQLELHWGLKVMTAPGLHGMYVSFKMDYEQLAVFAENRKLKNKRKELKDIKQAARISAMEKFAS